MSADTVGELDVLPALAAAPQAGYNHGRLPTRAATAPYPDQKDAPPEITARRAQTLPTSLPQFSPSLQSHNSSFLTPGLSISKTLGDVDVESLKDTSEARKQSKLSLWLDDTTQKTLAFMDRHWIIFSLVFMLVVVIISMAIGFSLRLGDFDASQILDDTVANAGTAVILEANLIEIDSDSQSMTLDWFVYYNCPQDDCLDVNVYFDQNLLRSSGSSSVANNAKPPPVFSINGTDYISRNILGDWRTSSPEFRTQVAITNFYQGGRSAQSYPFDKYFAQLVFFAETADGNATVPIGINATYGIAVGFNAALDTSESYNAADGVSFKTLTVTRGQVIRIYAILIVISIWLVTLTFIMACISTLVFGKGVKADILVVPVATLFAFTSLRSTMPGAPAGFGADIDFVGILPCLALLTLSSVFMSAIFLFRDPEVSTERWKAIQAQLHTKSA